MKMRKGHIIFLILTVLINGCQLPSQYSKDSSLPTPFKGTLDATKPQSTIAKPQVKIPSLQPKQTTATDDLLILTETKIWTNQVAANKSQPQKIELELLEEIDKITTQSGGRWHIIIKEVDGPTIYTILPDQRINIASVVKIPLALLFFAALDEKGTPEDQLEEHIQSTGTGGRTFEQLLHAMLVNSEEDATNVLEEYISLYVNVPAQLREWGIQDIDLEARRFTVFGVASLFERLYMGEFVSPTARKLILGYLSDYTPNDETRIGVLRNYIPASFKIYNKRGSLLSPYVVADTAILENPNGDDYILAIFAYNSEPKVTYEILDQAIGEIALGFWEIISSEN